MNNPVQPANEQIAVLARAEGFDLVGVTPLSPPPDADRFLAWIQAGLHGSMDYLRRNSDRICNPALVLSGARSIISLGVNHARPAGGFAGGGRVARYALGKDYHTVVDRMLDSFIQSLRRAGIGTVYRGIVDAGPALERSLAARAAIGFPSKSANLLNYKYGPWFFLAELFVDIDSEPPASRAPGSCGTCTLCIQQCPTGAIVAPGSVDARICISYLTIEHRGPIDEPLRPLLGNWVFGCDVCSEVCPFGDGAPTAADRFGTHPSLSLTLEQILLLDDAAFSVTFAGSPMRRAKREGLLRNAAIVIANEGRTGAIKTLERVAGSDPSAVVRDAAQWSLRRLKERFK